MKTIKTLLALLTLVVFATSCATTQDAVDSDADEATARRIGNRVYVDDPFYGPVVLERDPFTGRYFDVTYGYGRFGSPYNRWNYPGAFGPYYRSPRLYRGSAPQRQQAPRQQNTESRNEARGKILGN